MHLNSTRISNGATANLRGRPRSETIAPQDQDSTRTLKRETDPVTAAEADVDAISNIGTKLNLENSKGLSTTPMMWMCIVIIAVIILIIACVLGHRRQN